LACVSCGGETKVGALMCRRCLEGIVDPLSLTSRAQDPCSDARLQQMGSISLRIGPVVGTDLSMGGGVEPALRLRSLMEKPDKTSVPSFVEEYLAAAGIGMHVWGYERLPRRALIWRVVEDCEELEFNSEVWARASVRMGNLHALTVLGAIELPLDETWLSEFVRERSKAALKLYARADRHPMVARVARSNVAMLFAWLGRTDEAIKILDELMSEQMDEENANLTLKKAMILCDSGRRIECSRVLGTIPDELMDWRAKRFRADLEGSQ
jgi:hypothetical protein